MLDKRGRVKIGLIVLIFLALSVIVIVNIL